MDDDPRERLLDAAGEIFAERGFKGATVQAITQHAGVNIAAVNYYFRDKEGLYIEAVKAACCRQADSFPLPNWLPDTSAADRLADFIRIEVAAMVSRNSRPWERQLMLMELGHPTPACAELVSSKIQPRANVLGEILGELLPEMSSSERYLVGFSIIGQAVFHRMAQPIIRSLIGEEEYATYDAERLADHIISFTFAALGLAPPLMRQQASAKKSATSSTWGADA